MATGASTADAAVLLGASEFLVKSVVQFGHERPWTHLGFRLRGWVPNPHRASSPGPLSKG